MRTANPLWLLVLICAFVCVYFVYLRRVDPAPSNVPSPNAETDNGGDGAPRIDGAAEPLAYPVVLQQKAPDQPGRQDVVSQPGQPEAPQQTPPSVPLAQPGQNRLLQPIAAPVTALVEGHWIGLEVIPLTAIIVKWNSIPPEITGVLIDEVTLLSAEAGFYAGDVITAVNGKKVTDLSSFQEATMDVAQANRANVSVFRSGKKKEIVVLSTDVLGIAQMEGAPMILATDRSPHGYYGPCDKCHTIAKSASNSKNALNQRELLKDQGDSLTMVAPNIRRGTPAPHRNRGTCTLCHIVL
jgi:hypothetical protein